MSHADKIGRLYEVRCATGALKCLAYAIGYADAPTLIFEDADGRQWSWREDLCYDPTLEGSLDYWKTRALAAESALRKIPLPDPPGESAP